MTEMVIMVVAVNVMVILVIVVVALEIMMVVTGDSNDGCHRWLWCGYNGGSDGI